MRLPIRAVRGRWPGAVERIAPLRRFFRLDPTVILDAGARPDEFREAMSSIYIGGTIKITGSARHPETDRLLTDSVDTRRSRIVDIGASDGSTSLDLIRTLPGFSQYVIADLYLTLRVVRLGRRVLLFHDSICVLVVGPRCMAWPAESAAVRALFSGLITRAVGILDSAETVLLLNPEVQRLMEADARVTCQVHDVFDVWPGEKPDVIKVANLLRRLYFDDADLLRALTALRDSLPDGGHLLVVDNPRSDDPRPRAGVWRRSGQVFEEVARLREPEIADLVALVGRSA